MTDMTTFEPKSVTAPIRSDFNVSVLGRPTSTGEQRREAEDWMIRQMSSKNLTAMKAKIVWTRGDPTILEITARQEHMAGNVPYLSVATIQEYTLNGAEMKDSPKLRMRTLTQQVAEMLKAGELN